jgi:hypothetical protein
MFTLKFKTDGSAFDGNYEREAEITRILESIVEKIQLEYKEGNIMDINGNSIGSWKLTNR